MSRWLTRVLLAPVRLYQRFVSPLLPASCRYYPTCSAYAVTALEVHGPVKGTLLAAWRLLRCNPLTPGGVDHVPDKGRWRYDHPRDVPRFMVASRSRALIDPDEPTDPTPTQTLRSH